MPDLDTTLFQTAFGTIKLIVDTLYFADFNGYTIAIGMKDDDWYTKLVNLQSENEALSGLRHYESHDYEEGYQDGYDDGEEDGYDKGYSDAERDFGQEGK